MRTGKKFVKIILSLTLAFICVLSACILAGCGGTVVPAESSAADESSAPDVEKTPEEKVRSAMQTLRSSATGWAAATPLKALSEPKKEEQESGKASFKLSCPSFTLNGKTLNPGNINAECLRSGDDLSVTIGRPDAGPNALTLTKIGQALYLYLEGVTDQAVKIGENDLKELIGNLTGNDDPGETSDEPSVPDPAQAEQKAKELQEKFSQLYDRLAKAFEDAPFEESGKDGAAVFTKTLDETTMKTFEEEFRKLTGEVRDAVKGIVSDIPSEDVEEPSNVSYEDTISANIGKAVLSYTISEERIRNINIKVEDENGKEIAEINADVKEEDGRTTVALNFRNSEKEVLKAEYAVKPEAGKTEVKFTLSVPEKKLDAECTVNFTELSETHLAFSADLKVSVDKDGLLVTIPASMDGYVDRTDVKSTFMIHFAAAAGDVLNTDLSFTAEYTKEQTSVKAPDLSVPFSEVMKNPLELLNKLLQKYPEIADLIKQNEDLPVESVGQVYASETGDVTLSFYEAEGSVTALVYVYYDEDDDLLTFSSDEVGSFSTKYEKENDSKVRIFNVDMTRVESDYVSYVSENLIVELYESEKVAAIQAGFPWDGNTENIVLKFPDGTSFLSPVTISEDGKTAKVGKSLVLEKFDWSDAG